MMVKYSANTIKNNDVDATNINSTTLTFCKSFSFIHQFNKFSPEPKNEPVNIVNSNYYDNDQFETLKFHEIVSHYPQNLPHFQYKFAKLFF